MTDEHNVHELDDIIFHLSFLLFILGICASRINIHLSIPAASFCFIAQFLTINKLSNSDKTKFLLFSPISFVIFDFWFLYLFKNIKNFEDAFKRIPVKVKGTYIFIIILVIVSDILYFLLSIFFKKQTEKQLLIDDEISEQSESEDKFKPIEPSIEAQIPQKKRFDLYNDEFDLMTSADFRDYCAELLKKNGFKTRKAPYYTDIDIIATKDDTTYAFSCNCCSDNDNIDVNEVLLFATAVKHSSLNINVAVILTNQFFTKQAEARASKAGIILWDRDFLIYLVSRKNKVSLEPKLQNIYDYDIYFADCARYAIETQEISVPILQRTFKINSSRAEKIMNQLSNAGVIGAVKGDTESKVLMNTLDELDEFLNTIKI